MKSPVHDLAAQQLDRLVEKTLALVFTDRPMPAPDREDDRRHWQFLVRPDSENFGSTLWLSDGAPLTSLEVQRIQERARAALTPLVQRRLAVAVDVSAVRVDHDTVDLTIAVKRHSQPDMNLNLSLVRNSHA